MKLMKVLKGLLKRKTDTEDTSAPETIIERAECIIKKILEEEQEGATSFDDLSPKTQELLSISIKGDPKNKSFSEIKKMMHEIIAEVTLIDMFDSPASGPPNPYLLKEDDQ